MATNIQPQFPNITAPIAQANGQIHPAWQALLQDLWKRVNQVQNNQTTLATSITQAAQDGTLLVPPDRNP